MVVASYETGMTKIWQSSCCHWFRGGIPVTARNQIFSSPPQSFSPPQLLHHQVSVQPPSSPPCSESTLPHLLSVLLHHHHMQPPPSSTISSAQLSRSQEDHSKLPQSEALLQPPLSSVISPLCLSHRKPRPPPRAVCLFSNLAIHTAAFFSHFFNRASSAPGREAVVSPPFCSSTSARSSGLHLQSLRRLSRAGNRSRWELCATLISDPIQRSDPAATRPVDPRLILILQSEGNTWLFQTKPISG